MTITVYPADAVSGAPSYTGRKLRQAMSALAAGATAARPLGGLSGVRPGSGVVGSATSTTWTITPHAGQLDLQAAAEASVYQYAIDANATGAVTAADASNPRVDIVYLTLNDPAEGDGSATPGVIPGYLAGTPAATPAAPATPARSVVLFTIAVPKAGGGSPTVTMAAPEVGGAGAPIGVRSQAQRDALFPTPYVGLRVLRLDLQGVIETHTGTLWAGTWQTFAPVLYSDPAGAKTAIGTTVGYARYRYMDAHTVHAQVNCARQAGSTVPSLGVSLPVTAAFRSLNCGTLVVSGSSAPAGQSLRAYMSPDQTMLIPTAFTNGFLAVDPLQSVSYDVTYEV